MPSLWNRSSMVERQDDDLRAGGALAYFFQGGTVTPLTVYEDAAEGAAHPHPVVADAKGRWPDVFVPYIVGYDVRVTTSDGVQISFTQNIPNPDPVDVSVTIPPANQVQTGMVHAELANTTKSGFVRLNGRTMGNAVSGGTERANADTSDLFTYLWNNVSDSLAPVSGGRGGSAASDFAANKTITLPDMRGSIFTGLDDMGNSAAGAFSGLSFNNGSGTSPGSSIGGNAQTLSINQVPSHTHSGSTTTDGSHAHGGSTGSVNLDGHTHSTFVSLGGTTSGMNANNPHSHGISPTAAQASGLYASGALASAAVAGPSATQNTDINHGHDWGSSGTFNSGGTGGTNHGHAISSDGSHSHTFTTNAAGSGNAFNNLPGARLVTWYIKL